MTDQQRELLRMLQASEGGRAELWALPTEPLPRLCAAGCASIDFSHEIDEPARVSITEHGRSVLADPNDPVIEV